METKSLIAVIIGITGFVAIVGIITVSTYENAQRIRENINLCVEKGGSPIECKCTFRYCN